MRKWLLLPVLCMIIACGGAHGLGTDEFTYPHTRNLVVEFKNMTSTPVKIWTEPDEVEPAIDLAANTTRNLNVARTWDQSTSTFVFTFKAREGAGPIATTSISINGEESHAQNFSGFLVQWVLNPVTATRSLRSETQ